MLREDRLLVGAIDTHSHACPYIDDMLNTDVFETARAGGEAQMRSIVIKNPYGSSAGWAYLANKYAGGCQIIGGCTLNKAAGGFNPELINITAKEGEYQGFYPGKIVWFPERDSTMVAAFFKTPIDQALSPYRNNRIEDGLLPEAVEVLKAVAENDMVLALSHTEPEQALSLIPEAKKLGVKKFILTHASASTVGYTLEQKKRAVELGDVYIEESYVAFTPAMRMFTFAMSDPIEDVINPMKEIGPEYYILSTDCGYATAPAPVTAMKLFIRLVLDSGFSENDVVMMAQKNAAKVLGLD